MCEKLLLHRTLPLADMRMLVHLLTCLPPLSPSPSPPGRGDTPGKAEATLLQQQAAAVAKVRLLPRLPSPVHC